MMRLILFSCLFSLFLPVKSQYEDTVRIFYDINVSDPPPGDLLSAGQLGRIRREFGAIRITGYADFLHHPDYNLDLSRLRAEKVKARLLRQDPKLKTAIVTCEGLGEEHSADNGSRQGEPGMRKVEIVIVYPVEKEKPLPPADEKAESVVPKKEIRDMKEGESVALEGLSFVPGRHKILESSMPVLEKLLNTLLEHPKLKVEIQGHVCCTQRGEDGYDYDAKDYKLSEHRARAVYDYLVEHGVKPSRLKHKGYAGRQRKVEEISEAHEQMNRRVEIRILENK